MVFVTADGDAEDPERTVLSKTDRPTEDQLREALLTPEPIHYGTHFSLAIEGVERILAVCTSGPTAQANKPGQFLVYVDGALVSERASRYAVLEQFLAALRQ